LSTVACGTIPNSEYNIPVPGNLCREVGPFLRLQSLAKPVDDPGLKSSAAGPGSAYWYMAGVRYFSFSFFSLLFLAITSKGHPTFVGLADNF
jgi:hypothetical protein